MAIATLPAFGYDQVKAKAGLAAKNSMGLPLRRLIDLIRRPENNDQRFGFAFDAAAAMRDVGIKIKAVAGGQYPLLFTAVDHETEFDFAIGHKEEFLAFMIEAHFMRHFIREHHDEGFHMLVAALVRQRHIVIAESFFAMYYRFTLP